MFKLGKHKPKLIQDIHTGQKAAINGILSQFVNHCWFGLFVSVP